MKTELIIDSRELGREISAELIAVLRPILTDGLKKDEHLFNVKTLSEYLEVSQQFIYQRVQFKEIPFVKLGRFLRFRETDILHWLGTLKTPPMKSASEVLRKINQPV